MKKLTRYLALAGVTALCLGASSLFAQDQGSSTNKVRGGQGGGQGGDQGGRGDRGDRGNFDPAQFQQQMQQRIMDGIRERLDIKDDTEWQAMEPLVKKVVDLRRDQMMGGMRGAFGGMGRGGRGGGGPGGGGPGGFRFGPEPSAEETALTEAIEGGSSKDILKEKMAAFRKARAAKEAELKAAQENLKKVLTTRQEAVALEMGLVI